MRGPLNVKQFDSFCYNMLFVLCVIPFDGRLAKTIWSFSANSLSVLTVPCLVTLFDNVAGVA